MPIDGMEWRLLLYDLALSFEATDLLTEAALQHSIRGEDLV